MQKLIWAILCVVVVVSALTIYQYGRGIWVPVYSKFAGRSTVAEVIARIGEKTGQRLQPRFTAAGIAYPPKSITLLATKQEAELELWASDGEALQYIHTYSILKTSGTTGPKLREGDRQVPEGIYRVVGLNPNSAYHLP